MPQPYPNHLTLKASNEKALEKRPLHYLGGMAVIAENSMVEAVLPNLLIAMLGSNPEPAAALYGSLRNGRVQKEAMLAVGKEVLSNEDQALLSSVMRLVDASAKSRDTIAHSVWFYDDQLPDGVLLAKPDVIWRTSVKAKAPNTTRSVSDEEALALQAQMTAACTVWKIPDFEDARIRAVRAFTAAIAMSQVSRIAASSEDRDQSRQTIRNICAQR